MFEESVRTPEGKAFFCEACYTGFGRANRGNLEGIFLSLFDFTFTVMCVLESEVSFGAGMGWGTVTFRTDIAWQVSI